MRHVFVETNWLVAVAAPAYTRKPAALELLQKANNGEIRIYLPTCCIAEARKTIRRRFQPKEADVLRSYLRWAIEEKKLNQNVAEPAREMLQSFVGQVTSELKHLNDTLREVSTARGLELVSLDDKILELSVELQFKEVEPSEFDRAVLAAVLARGTALSAEGEKDVNFCQLDSKLWPWEKGSPERDRPELKSLYDGASVWVYSDFTLATPERPEDFSKKQK